MTEIKSRRFIRDLIEQYRQNEKTGRHGRRIMIPGEKLPGGLEPKQVEKNLPERWEMRVLTPDNYSEEARDMVENDLNLFSTIFYPPKDSESHLV